MVRIQSRFSPDSWINGTGWFLAVSYVIGACAAAVAEYVAHVISMRFGYPPGFIYFVCATQFACAIALFAPALRVASIVGLTFVSLGATVSHFRIGSPLTALPAMAYTVIQLWFAVRVRTTSRSPTHR